MAAKRGQPLPKSAPLENVPKYSTLNRAQMLVLGRDGGDTGVTLDLMRPEDSPWLQEIFKEVQSDDEGRRMFAVWRFKETYHDFCRGGTTRAKGVNVSNYVLTHGFAEEISRGLMDAVTTGRWYFVPKDYAEATAAGKV
jgi:hypothetical protein